MALIRLTFLLLLATFISGNALAASRGIANPALFPNRVVAQEQAPIDLLTGLVYSGNFDDGGWDCSGEENHFSTNGVIAGLTDGVITNAFRFDGTNNYFVLSNAPIDFSHNSACSVSMWIRLTDRNIDELEELYLLSIGTPDCDEAAAFVVRGVIHFLDTTQLTIEARDTFGDGTGLVTLWQSNTWYHLALTLTNDTLTLWWNGEAVAEEFLDSLFETGDFALYLGSSCLNDGSSIDIDEVKMWTRALGTNEITYLFENPEEASIACEVPGGITNVTRGLVGWWKMDEGENTTVADSSGTGANGTLTGGTWTTGKFGGGINFAGTNDYVTIASDCGIAAYPFTLSGWIKIADTNQGNATIISLNDNGTSNVHYRNSTGTGLAKLMARNTTAVETIGDITLVPGQWHFIVCVFVNSTTRRLYVDAVLDDTGTVSVNFNSNTDQIYLHRTRSTDTADMLEATLDDCRIYNVDLSADEISLMYQWDGVTP